MRNLESTDQAKIGEVIYANQTIENALTKDKAYKITGISGDKSCFLVTADSGITQAGYFAYRFYKMEQASTPKLETKTEEIKTKMPTKFKYLDINYKPEWKTGDPIPSGVTFFNKPFSLGGGTYGENNDYNGFSNYWAKVYSYSSTTTTGTRHSDKSSRNFYTKDVLAVKYPIESLVMSFALYPRIFTIKPNEEAKKAIKAVLSFVKPKGFVFISETFLDNTVGFDGLSIYCDNIKVIFRHKDEWVRLDLSPGSSYSKIIKEYSCTDVTKNRDVYRIILNKAVTPGLADHGIHEVSEKVRVFKNSKDGNKNYLTTNSVKYNETRAALPELDTASLPKGLLPFVKEVKKKAKEFVTTYDLEKKSYETNLNSYRAEKESYDFVDKSNKNPGEDFALVKKLLGNGTIESIDFKKGVLSWTYPPLVYDTQTPSFGKVFLGRIKVSIDEARGCISPLMLSYANNRCVGTYHFYQSDGQLSICYGSFLDPLRRLIAAKRVGDLILLSKAYLMSCNLGSKNGTPGFEHMYMPPKGEPQVKDDSWTVYKKTLESKPKKAVVEAQVVENPF